jgi:hypothetical protein
MSEMLQHAPPGCRGRYALHLFWSPLETSGGAKAHLRVFLLLRSVSFALSTLQLRSGYPPPASYRRVLLPSEAHQWVPCGSKEKCFLETCHTEQPCAQYSPCPN